MYSPGINCCEKVKTYLQREFRLQKECIGSQKDEEDHDNLRTTWSTLQSITHERGWQMLFKCLGCNNTAVCKVLLPINSVDACRLFNTCTISPLLQTYSCWFSLVPSACSSWPHLRGYMLILFLFCSSCAHHQHGSMCHPRSVI